MTAPEPAPSPRRRSPAVTTPARTPSTRVPRRAPVVDEAAARAALVALRQEVGKAVIGQDAVVLVDDGTRPVDVWCPAGTSPWGPVHKRRFEFEVTLEGPVADPRDLEGGLRRISMHTRAWKSAEDDPGTEAFSGDLERHRPSAIATDIRPLD